MKKIVLATHNQGKVNELHDLLSDQGYTVVSQCDYDTPEPDETGLTFIENALIKARHAAAFTGLPAMADDSGLAVIALNGSPGIYSARYAGENATDQNNNEKLLQTLAAVPGNERQAYFYCALVYLRHEHDPTPIVCEGKWNGTILTNPQGKNGFGYDPLFYIPELGCTAAELTREQKNRFSHRGQALQLMIKTLHQYG